MPQPVEHLINEVRLLYQSLVQIGEKLHHGSNISMGMRAVLEYLDRNGDSTVPQMARARRVSRQRIQSLVNNLAQSQLVAQTDNPASKRSPLITLTTRGATTIRDMRKREGAVMRMALAGAQIDEATRTLAQVRQTLETNVDL